MRLLPWDPDVETITSRINAGVLDLQPDFQRGEVWSKNKKQRLIDSILRDWHVPPIHVVENTITKRQEVLDGQQRLVAIRDFARDDFEVDGTIEPVDPEIVKLDGMIYSDLPEEVKRIFNQFSLRVYRIVDYKSTEPAELFFRLNQPTNLTGAEQRNAFFGPVRQQIKELVEKLPSYGFNKNLIGFSNSRMAYDDVLCRVALTIERGSLGLKLSSSDLVALYRSDNPLSARTIYRLEKVLALLGEAGNLAAVHPRFNKSTIYSWLIFGVRSLFSEFQPLVNEKFFAEFMTYFEEERLSASNFESSGQQSTLPFGWSNAWLFKTYGDRSTSRVADVSSVILRDIAIWLAFTGFINERKGRDVNGLPPEPLRMMLSKVSPFDEDLIAKTAIELGWGNLP